MIGDPQRAFGAVMQALGMKPTGDPAADVSAARTAFASLCDAVDPAAQQRAGARLGLSVRELAQCRDRRLDVREYARSKASIQRTAPQPRAALVASVTRSRAQKARRP